MASEYYKWKYRNEQHRETPEYTAEERRKNWWYYNKWNVIFGIIAAILLIDLFRTATGMKTEKPDCMIAFITERTLDQETIEQFENELAVYADDYNGDGKTLIKIRQYLMPENPTAEEQIYASYASEITLVSDIEECSSFLFIMKDPEAFQKAFAVLSYPDGSLPEETVSGLDCAAAWKDLPVFGKMDIDPELREILKDCYIGRRGFWTEKTTANAEQCAEFFHTLIAQKGQ